MAQVLGLIGGIGSGLGGAIAGLGAVVGQGLITLARKIIDGIIAGFRYFGQLLRDRLRELAGIIRWNMYGLIRGFAREPEAMIAFLIFWREVMFG